MKELKVIAFVFCYFVDQEDLQRLGGDVAEQHLVHEDDGVGVSASDLLVEEQVGS